MTAIFADIGFVALANFHDAATRAPPGLISSHTDETNVWHWIEQNHHCNRQLWEQEDEARRIDVCPAAIAANKRAIDTFNQRRNDAIERMDEVLLSRIAQVRHADDALLNSETAGSIIDRLSILALKIYHMDAQTSRSDATAEHVANCLSKLERLTAQRRDLGYCLDTLLRRATQGSSFWRVYRQFKMYNDPTLNPWLYNKSR